MYLNTIGEYINIKMWKLKTKMLIVNCTLENFGDSFGGPLTFDQRQPVFNSRAGLPGNCILNGVLGVDSNENTIEISHDMIIFVHFRDLIF